MRQKKKKKINIIKGSRKIHIGKDIWYWKHCFSGCLIISPERKKSLISYDEIYGEVYDVERARWKRYFHVKPSHVKTYIERRFYETQKEKD